MNQYERTVRIPVKINNGQIVCDDGKPIPKLSERMYGELVVPYIFLAEKEDQEKYSEKEKKKIFNKGEHLYFELNANYIPNDANIDSKLLVKVILEEDLYLSARYREKAKFYPCKCSIPSLKIEADSLNHAYTLMSQRIETTRKSHTGNVFNVCFFIKNDKLVKLGVKRDELFDV